LRTFVIAVAAVVTLVACKNHETKPQQQPVAAGKSIDIKISGGEYSPASFTVAKGQTVRLNFTRDEKPTCGDTVVIPSMKIKKTIPVNQVVSIDITPQQAGELQFTCGMDMMKGTIVVQ
jgi:plastocyanin domain-containing protein